MDICTYVELEHGQATEVSLQCLTLARGLADQSDGQVTALALGVEPDTATIIAQGADRVLAADNAQLAHYLPLLFSTLVVEQLSQNSPDAFLLPASSQGNDLASTVAAKLGAGCVLDCHAVRLEGDRLLLTRLEYDAKVNSHFQVAGSPQIATLHDGIAEIADRDPSRKGEVIALDVPPSSPEIAMEIVAREIAQKKVNLKDAKIIVAGGAGVGSKENFKLIEQLAASLGGEVGASRPAVDAGWTDYERQIGQTGTSVRPDLYIACGISGAVQHRVGMMDSRKIVAINNDPSAPIFRFAHVKIVADLTEVIPKLIELAR